MPALQTEYAMPIEAKKRLDALVRRIEGNPGRLITSSEVSDLESQLGVKSTVGSLPPGMTEEDFGGVLKLALLTECATDSYADAIASRARDHGAPWLERFTLETWAPDEYMHYAPFSHMLRSLGFSDAEMDREMLETQERRYVHGAGDTPIHLTTYAMLQEYLTDHWYGMIGRLTRETSPIAARMTGRVKQRETLHAMWYRDMTALQLEANPRLLPHIGEAIVHFQMPGNVLLPSLQAQVPRWLSVAQTDLDEMVRGLVRVLESTLPDTRSAGALVMEVATAKGMRMGPFSAKQVNAALRRLGGPGYGLIGEALLDRAGLGYLFRDAAEPDSSGPGDAVVGRLRSVMRGWVGSQIDMRMGFPDIPEAPA